MSASLGLDFRGGSSPDCAATPEGKLDTEQSRALSRAWSLNFSFYLTFKSFIGFTFLKVLIQLFVRHNTQNSS